jgi:hypothetical protein
MHVGLGTGQDLGQTLLTSSKEPGPQPVSSRQGQGVQAMGKGLLGPQELLARLDVRWPSGGHGAQLTRSHPDLQGIWWKSLFPIPSVELGCRLWLPAPS